MNTSRDFIDKTASLNSDTMTNTEKEMHSILAYSKVFMSVELYNLMPFFTFLRKIVFQKV